MNKILLLEDDIDLAQTIEELLVDEGCIVSLAHNGNDAIDISYETKFDLYIFDINVPEVNGLELLKSLREAGDFTSTIFISALIDLNTMTKAFNIGAEDYLKKPFFPEELLLRVNAKLKKGINEMIEYENLKYFITSKELYIDDKLISQGEVQQCLCELFFKNIGSILDKSILMECSIVNSDSALRVAINKFKLMTELPIKNIRGIGYILEKF